MSGAPLPQAGARRATAVAQLAAWVQSRRRSRPLRVALDGRTASGKTTLAQELAAALSAQGPVILVTIDGFHRPRAQRWAQGRDSAKGYYEDARDYAAARRLLLDPLGPGGDRMYVTRILDLATDSPVAEQRRLAPEDAVLLVEGSFLQRPEIVGAWDAVVLVDAPRSIAIARGAARDAAHLGRAQALALHQGRYAEAWDGHYVPEAEPRDGADVLFDNSDPASPVLTIRSAP